jgi:hypothetical protein
MQSGAFTCATLRGAARLPAKIRALHESEFFLDVIEHSIALLQTLRSDRH